jgi:hypothetical protein
MVDVLQAVGDELIAEAGGLLAELRSFRSFRKCLRGPVARWHVGPVAQIPTRGIPRLAGRPLLGSLITATLAAV